MISFSLAAVVIPSVSKKKKVRQVEGVRDLPYRSATCSLARVEDVRNERNGVHETKLTLVVFFALIPGVKLF